MRRKAGGQWSKEERREGMPHINYFICPSYSYLYDSIMNHTNMCLIVWLSSLRRLFFNKHHIILGTMTQKWSQCFKKCHFPFIVLLSLLCKKTFYTNTFALVAFNKDTKFFTQFGVFTKCSLLFHNFWDLCKFHNYLFKAIHVFMYINVILYQELCQKFFIIFI